MLKKNRKIAQTTIENLKRKKLNMSNKSKVIAIVNSS